MKRPVAGGPRRAALFAGLRGAKKQPLCILQVVQSAQDGSDPAASETLKLMVCTPAEHGYAVRSVHHEAIPAGSGDTGIADVMKRLLKSFELRSPRVIVSLPRQYVTLRALKIPATSSGEIGRIVALQASKYLPYAPADLVTGFQVISTDPAGYSMVNLIVVHKDLTARYVKLFRELGIRHYAIGLSSYGLCSLFAAEAADSELPVCIVDIDASETEIAIARAGTMMMSRSFKLDRRRGGWEAALAGQLRRTFEVFSEEGLGRKPGRVIVTGAAPVLASCAEELNRHAGVRAEAVSYESRSGMPSAAPGSGYSFAGLAGYVLSGVPEFLNLIPAEVRAGIAQGTLRREALRKAAAVCCCAVLLLAASAKSTDNKTRYLGKLREALAAIEEQARPLENLRQKFILLQKRRAAAPSSLDVLRELPAVLPEGVVIVGFSFEDNKQLVIRGQSPELSRVFSAVTGLERSGALKDYTVKVQYATQRPAEAGGITDFELLCARKQG